MVSELDVKIALDKLQIALDELYRAKFLVRSDPGEAIRKMDVVGDAIYGAMQVLKQRR